MGLSRRAYAALRGVHESAVRKAIASGRITTEADGTIDAAKVQAEAKHTERKTLLLAIKAANEKGLKAKSGRDREQAIRESVELVNAIIRGEVAA